MRATLSACFCAWSILLCGSITHAQQVEGTTAGTDAATIKQIEDKNRDVLENDPRLKVKITLTKRSVSINEALRSLTSMTRINFIVEDNEAPDRRLSFAFESTPLKDILDGIAALYRYEMERRKSGVLVFRAKRGKDGLDPSTPAQQNIAQSGKEFAAGVDRLSPEMRDALGRGEVSVGALPPAMQNAAMGMLTGRINEMEGSPNNQAFTKLGQNLLGNFAKANARWRTNGDVCTLSLGMPNAGELGLTFRLPGR